MGVKNDLDTSLITPQGTIRRKQKKKRSTEKILLWLSNYPNWKKKFRKTRKDLDKYDFSYPKYKEALDLLESFKELK
jgi:hypothetical protein